MHVHELFFRLGIRSSCFLQPHCLEMLKSNQAIITLGLKRAALELLAPGLVVDVRVWILHLFNIYHELLEFV